VNTRRNVGLTLGRVLTLAVYPLKIIAVSPFPKGLLPRPKKGTGKALADYRPDDDARLLGCAAVPLAYRLLWGFLAREGMRSSEAIQLRWGDVDLNDGSVVLDENKSDDPRSVVWVCRLKQRTNGATWPRTVLADTCCYRSYDFWKLAHWAKTGWEGPSSWRRR